MRVVTLCRILPFTIFASSLNAQQPFETFHFNTPELTKHRGVVRTPIVRSPFFTAPGRVK